MRLSEEPSKPSRVLHLRGLPPDTTEAEITQLTTLFGITTNIILTRQKNQVVALYCALLCLISLTNPSQCGLLVLLQLRDSAVVGLTIVRSWVRRSKCLLHNKLLLHNRLRQLVCGYLPPTHNHTCLHSLATRRHCPLAGTHCIYPRRDCHARYYQQH